MSLIKLQKDIIDPYKELVFYHCSPAAIGRKLPFGNYVLDPKAVVQGRFECISFYSALFSYCVSIEANVRTQISCIS